MLDERESSIVGPAFMKARRGAESKAEPIGVSRCLDSAFFQLGLSLVDNLSGFSGSHVGAAGRSAAYTSSLARQLPRRRGSWAGG